MCSNGAHHDSTAAIRNEPHIHSDEDHGGDWCSWIDEGIRLWKIFLIQELGTTGVVELVGLFQHGGVTDGRGDTECARRCFV